MDYDSDKERLKDFLIGFCQITMESRGVKNYKYVKQLTALANRDQVALIIELNDMVDFYDTGPQDELIQNIENNVPRYTKIMSDIVAELLPEYKTRECVAKDSLDVYLEHRLHNFYQHQDNFENAPALDTQFPSELLKRFEIYFKPRREVKPLGIRGLKADEIGKLVTVHGVVIRASEVRPLLNVATYSCDTCSAETFQTVTGSSFLPIVTCASEFCKGNKTGGRLMIQTRGSKFTRFQEIRIQEQSSEVPAGHVPRTLTVHCRGENARLASAGDHVSITGVFLPISRSTGFAQMAQGLLTDTYLDAHRIIPISKWDDGEVGGDLTEEEIQEFSGSGDLYGKLASSIAPEVYGHEDIKKSLLLQLVGGVDRDIGGLKIRGTINICLMGDPGVAKSQILSYIDRLAPRSQLTSGRGSSGVGLTASVMKDPVTGLMTLEAGALMLADEGICCIDEFDKMNESDRTSLHEVMEQQTISIAKAGILTTLHARTAVLAAANPAYGRYNPGRSIQDNINLPAALLSRFDLLWLMQDKPDSTEDERLAKHITYVHTNLREPPTAHVPLDMALMRRFILACKKRNPTIPPELSESLVEAYVELRNDARNAQETTFTSPRSLLAILRFSTALARLRMDTTVTERDVKEAIRLVERSRDSIKPGHMQQQVRAKSTNDQIHAIVIRFIRDRKGEEIPIKTILAKCQHEGFNTDQVERCLDLYEGLNLWTLNSEKTTLTLV